MKGQNIELEKISYDYGELDKVINCYSPEDLDSSFRAMHSLLTKTLIIAFNNNESERGEAFDDNARDIGHLDELFQAIRSLKKIGGES